jgi:hypothetical protein
VDQICCTSPWQPPGTETKMFCAPDAGRLQAWLWFRIGDWSDWITCYRQTWRWRGSAHSFREQQRSQTSGNGFIWFTSGSAVQGASSGKALLSSGHTVSLSRFVKVRSRWFIWAWADERFRQQSAKVVRCLVSSRRRVKSRTTQGKQVALSVLFFLFAAVLHWYAPCMQSRARACRNGTYANQARL